MNTRNWTLIRTLLIVVVVGASIGGCGQESKVVTVDPCDPNEPTLVTTYHGKAADTIAETDAANRTTVEGRRTKIVESLIPYYGILFICGIAGIVIIVVLRQLGMPSKVLWIAPVACFGGMALIHFFSDFAAYFKWIVAGGMILIFLSLHGWKLIEYKFERNKNDKSK